MDAKAEEIKNLEIFKKLIYASGQELEDIFEACLKKLGGIIGDARYSDEEFVLHYEGESYLVECKGVGKSISRSHVLQLLGYLTKFEETEGRSGKGILFGNAWRDIPPTQRGETATVIFPDNVIGMAVSNNIALLASTEFFQAFCDFLAGEITGKVILDRITNAVGVVQLHGI